MVSTKSIQYIASMVHSQYSTRSVQLGQAHSVLGHLSLLLIYFFLWFFWGWKIVDIEHVRVQFCILIQLCLILLNILLIFSHYEWWNYWTLCKTSLLKYLHFFYYIFCCWSIGNKKTIIIKASLSEPLNKSKFQSFKKRFLLFFYFIKEIH